MEMGKKETETKAIFSTSTGNDLLKYQMPSTSAHPALNAK